MNNISHSSKKDSGCNRACDWDSTSRVKSGQDIDIHIENGCLQNVKMKLTELESVVNQLSLMLKSGAKSFGEKAK